MLWMVQPGVSNQGYVVRILCDWRLNRSWRRAVGAVHTTVQLLVQPAVLLPAEKQLRDPEHLSLHAVPNAN